MFVTFWLVDMTERNQNGKELVAPTMERILAALGRECDAPDQAEAVMTADNAAVNFFYFVGVVPLKPAINSKRAAGKHSWQICGKRNLVFEAALAATFVEKQSCLDNIIANMTKNKGDKRKRGKMVTKKNIGAIGEVYSKYLKIFGDMMDHVGKRRCLEKWEKKIKIFRPLSSSDAANRAASMPQGGVHGTYTENGLREFVSPF